MIVYNFIDVKVKLNKSKIDSLIKKLCKNEGKEIISINFNICNDEYLLALNNKHLKHDYLTDIITFDLSDKINTLEGDIYISLDRIMDNSEMYKTTINRELVRVMLHGILHLCGYGDKSKSEIKVMRSKEEEYLAVYST